MKKFLGVLALLSLLGFAGLCVADGYVNGHVTPAGYTYRDGYWWRDGYSYARHKVYYPQTYSYGYGYVTPSPSYYWQYDAVQLPTQAHADPGDWRAGLLQLARQRDKAELELRKNAVEQSAYLQSLKALGLEGNFRLQNYGQPLLFPGAGNPFTAPNPGYGYGNPNLGTFGANGNTIYGYNYSYNVLKDAYGDLNLNQLYQAAARNTQTAQQLGGQASTEFSTLVQQAGDNQARVAEILAKAQAAKTALDAANPQPMTRTQISGSGTVTGSGSGSTSGPVPNPNADPNAQPATMPPAGVLDNDAFLRTVAVVACGNCHSGNNVKGKFDVTKWFSYTPDQRGAVLDRIYTTDKTLVMPPPNSGVVLTPEQKRQFASH